MDLVVSSKNRFKILSEHRMIVPCIVSILDTIPICLTYKEL